MDQWRPDRGRNFAILLEAEIGPAGGSGSEVFSVRAVGVDWLAAQPVDKGFRWGRGLLVLDEWSPEIAERAIAELCRRTEGETWADIRSHLARFLDGEFDRYEPDAG